MTDTLPHPTCLLACLPTSLATEAWQAKSCCCSASSSPSSLLPMLPVCFALPLLPSSPAHTPAACQVRKPVRPALQAHKKAIRRATVNTFGYIAKAIGPQDVLVTLLNNLKVQERQNRVCTTVAIAIVAETCSPFTVLPALMNEYKVGTSTAKVVHNAGC